MANPKYNFQFCQKLVVFSKDEKSILLARRKDEADYDGTFSFIGGKMDAGDQSILVGLRREKNEEIGASAQVRVYLLASNNLLFRKADGSNMILPHYLAQYTGGGIVLNSSEYAEYRWVPIEDLPDFEPKIPNIPDTVAWALALKKTVGESDYTEL